MSKNQRVEGLVMRSTGSNYTVKLSHGDVVECKLRGRLKLDEIDHTNPVAVGDRVLVELDSDFTGNIDEIHPRHNHIIRKSVNLSKRTQIIAANIDQALLVTTCAAPRTAIGFIDRFLLTAEAYHIPTVIVFNKYDVYKRKEMAVYEQYTSIYHNMAGYTCIETSVVSGLNLEKIKALLHNKTTLLSGNSGVGKSSLINAIDPNLQLKTGEISTAHDKGKHTTTFAEMFALDFGGYVIDTPGIKSFGIVDFDKEEIGHYFPEMRAVFNQCKFNNCVHINEPGCAVQQAVEAGLIAEDRYKSYLSFYYDNPEENYRK